MPKVFVSHSTHDRRFVESVLIPTLTAHGIESWYSKQDIRGASEWARRIVVGMKECDWFLVVMSHESAESQWVRDEVHWAMDHRWEKIVPVLIDDCDPMDLHLRLRRIQFIDFRQNNERAREQLLQVCDTISPQPTPAPSPRIDPLVDLLDLATSPEKPQDVKPGKSQQGGSPDLTFGDLGFLLVTIFEIALPLVLILRFNFWGAANVIGLLLWLILAWLTSVLCWLFIHEPINTSRVGIRVVALGLALATFLVGGVNLYLNYQAFWSGWWFTFIPCVIISCVMFWLMPGSNTQPE
jgi:hypothetical protein